MKIFSKLEYKIPKREKIALIGMDNTQIAKDIIKNKFTKINLDKINIFILVKLFFSKGIKIYDFKINYLEQYLKFIGSDILICFIDNNPLFWRIKNKIPSLKVLIIQNGWRTKTFDIFESKIRKRQDYKVDYFFTFNRFISKLYKDFVKAKFVEIGSVENNFYNIYKYKKKIDILYLSEYFDLNKSTAKLDWFSIETILLPFIKNFCIQNNYSFKILPRVNSKKEFSFFKNILGKDINFNYLKKEVSSYEIIDRAKIVVFSSTTLGYEAFARKKKIFGICCKLPSDPSRCFGWPKYSRKNKGFFWINNMDLTKFKKKLNNLIKISNNEWLKNSKIFQQNLMIYDKNNFKLKSIINSLS